MGIILNKDTQEVRQDEWSTLVSSEDDFQKEASTLCFSLYNSENIFKFLASRFAEGTEREVFLISKYLPLVITTSSSNFVYYLLFINQVTTKLVHTVLNGSPTNQANAVNALEVILYNDWQFASSAITQLIESGLIDKLITNTNEESSKALALLALQHTTCKYLATPETIQILLARTKTNNEHAQTTLVKLAQNSFQTALHQAGIMNTLEYWDPVKAYKLLELLYREHAVPLSEVVTVFKICLRAAEILSNVGYIRTLLKRAPALDILKQGGAVEYTLEVMKRKKVDLTAQILNTLLSSDVDKIYDTVKQAGIPTENLPTELSTAITTYLRTLPSVAKLRDKEAPWYIDPAILPTQHEPDKEYFIVPGEPKDLAFVAGLYEKHPVPGYTLKSVQIVSSERLLLFFYGRAALLEARNKNKAFQASWEVYTTDPQELEQRKEIIQSLHELAKPYYYKRTPGVKYVPLWHGTNPAVLDSVFKTGFANLAKTDAGFFGKGLYSTVEAEYAYRVYSSGAVLVSWVAFYSAFPVIAKDEAILAEKGNFENYDAHFAPVYSPRHPNTTNYHACQIGEAHQYTEMVVFESSQMLPHYIVELQTILPREPTPQISIIASDTVTPSSSTTEENTELRKPDTTSTWSVDQVCKWATGLDLSQTYTDELRQHNINGVVLKSMLKQDWNDIGVNNFGDVRVLLICASKLK